MAGSNENMQIGLGSIIAIMEQLYSGIAIATAYTG
jgi:hypothetical protein